MNEKYKVWYIPQIPMPAFEMEVTDFATARIVLNAIIDFSIFEYENRVKPDYADAAGIMEWDEDEQEWADVDESDWQEVAWTSAPN